MKVFIAGATGVLGRALIPQLGARGHEVIGMTRSAAKQDLVRSLGARPVVADALDPDAVERAVASTEPEVIVHQLTAFGGPMSMREARHPDRSFAAIMTNRLRTEGTDHLLAAGRSLGARHLEHAVTTIEWGEGLVLRYGGFYGPGTAISLAPDATVAGPIRKRRFPVIGDGGGVVSHVHASALDAKPPRRMPRWLARLAAGEAAIAMMTDTRGASNAKAKRELDWKLRYPSWRQGFAQGRG